MNNFEKVINESANRKKLKEDVNYTELIGKTLDELTEDEISRLPEYITVSVYYSSHKDREFRIIKSSDIEKYIGRGYVEFHGWRSYASETYIASKSEVNEYYSKKINDAVSILNKTCKKYYEKALK